MCPIFFMTDREYVFPDLYEAVRLSRETRDCERFSSELGIIVTRDWEAEMNQLDAATDRKMMAHGSGTGG